MQLLILLYIEGGSYIDEEEDTWEFLVLYVANRQQYSWPSSKASIAGMKSVHGMEVQNCRLTISSATQPYIHSGASQRWYG
jgi:histone acetyltransferase 1